MMHSNEQSLKVSEIMSFPVITAFEGVGIHEVAAKMLRNKVGSIIVVDMSGRSIGIITQGDIVRHFAHAKPNKFHEMRANELMSRPLIFIDGNEKIEIAAKKMVQSKVKKLCVCDSKKNLIGIVTDNDIMKNASYLIDVLMDMVNIGYIKETA